MAAFKLVFNINKNHLANAGSAVLLGEKITIHVDPYSQVQLLRSGNLVKLAETTAHPTTVSGVVMEKDIYTIGSGEEKLVARVEKDEPQIFLKNQNLNQAEPQGKKTTLTVGVILLILLLLSVVFGIRQKNRQKNEEIYGGKLTHAISNYQESLNLFEVDKTKARTLFLESLTLLKEVEDAKYKDNRLENFAKEIKSKQGEILGEFKVGTSEFLDLTLQTSGFNGNSLVSSGEEMFIFDKELKKAIMVNIKTKKASLAVDSDQLNGANQIASYEDRVFAMKDDGIYELGGSSEDKVIDKDWGNAFFYLYSANVYLLDKDNNMVYRYPGTTDGFGTKSEWIAPGIEPDFSKIVDLTIDGSIWLLSSTGKVSKFTLGSPQSVSLEGLPDNLENPTAIYTNEENKNVYILDKNKGRVAVIDKTGDFVVAYTSDEIKNAKDLVVSEDQKKIILLTGAKLLTIDLLN